MGRVGFHFGELVPFISLNLLTPVFGDTLVFGDTQVFGDTPVFGDTLWRDQMAQLLDGETSLGWTMRRIGFTEGCSYQMVIPSDSKRHLEGSRSGENSALS